MPESDNAIPAWVSSLGVPVWVSGPDGRIAYLNARAATLLGTDAGAALGRPCHEVIAGVDSAGRVHCGPDCPVFRCAQRDRELEPIELSIGPRGGERHWVQVLVINVPGKRGRGPWLVHCAIPHDKSHRIEEYLEKVATRTGRPAAPGPAAQGDLTARETQVLQLLAEDHSLFAIADELCISYVTVRNHVQHILAKLGVHSISEAVARYLVVRDRTTD